jgi:hypothetical protein
VTLPDPEPRWNPGREHYDFGDIDWAEFKIIKTMWPNAPRQSLEPPMTDHLTGHGGARVTHWAVSEEPRT